MMTFNINQDSWHFRLQNFGAGEKYWGRYDTDICTYTRRVLWGLFRMTLLVAGIATILYSFSDFLYWIYMIIVGPYVGPGMGAFFIVMSLGVILVLCAMAGSVKGYEKLRDIQREKRKNAPPREPSFITLAYRKFKDKTCFKLKVIRKEDDNE